MTREERIKELERLIPNENVRNIIFNNGNKYRSFLRSDAEEIKYFYNSLILSSLVVYKSFLKWKSEFNKKSTAEKDKILSSFSNSSIRIFNLLDSCYSVKKFDLDFIENLIVNLQIDCILSVGSETSFLDLLGISDFFHFSSHNDSITRYIYQLKCSRLSSKISSSFNFDCLHDVIEKFAFLSKISAEYYPFKHVEDAVFDSVKLTINRTGDVIDLDELLICSISSFYYIEDFSFSDCYGRSNVSHTDKQELTLNYFSFSSFQPLKIKYEDGVATDKPFIEHSYEKCSLIMPTVVEDFLISYNATTFSPSLQLAKENDSFFFKDYISFNNRYIKYLALTISDLISLRTKQAILAHYKKDFAEVFSKLRVNSLYNNTSVQCYRWDEIIIFLLLEAGVFDFLTFLLSQGETYEAFITAFRLRFGKEKINEIIRKNVSIQSPTLSVNYKNADSVRKNQVRAIIALATKLLTVDDVTYAGFYYSPSIVDIILDLQTKSEAIQLSTFEKISYSVNLLIRVVLFIDSFYSGLIAYYIEWKNHELASNDFTYDEYISNKEAALATFSKEVSGKKVDNLRFTRPSSQNGISSYFETAINTVQDVFAQLNKTNDAIRNRDNTANAALFEALGKREIFNYEDMQILSDSIVSALKDCAEAHGNDQAAAKELIKAIKELFRYLERGSFEEGGYIENSIYPLIGTYSNGVVSLDGYRYSYMRITKNAGEKPIKIKMIVDDVFDFGQMYYCIPNLKRIANIKTSQGTERIWINPIIIPQQSYSTNTFAEFSRLNSEQDFPDVAKLLYHTDEKIYGNLFGDEKTAMTILPLLFKDPNSVFYKDYYYIVTMQSKVVAVASLYNKLPSWDCDAIEKAFRQAQIPIPESTRVAYKYFEDTFNDSVGENSVICDLCVEPSHRNLGLARYLIANIVKQLEGTGNNLLITAYKDNSIAINLYTSMGFIPYLSDVDTRGDSLDNQEYYKMIKYI